MNWNRDFHLERMTADERWIATAYFHVLNAEDQERRRKIMKEAMRIDIRWGFFNYGPLAWTKRWIYVLFIHRFLKKDQ